MGVSTTHRIYNLSMWILIYSFNNKYYVWAACAIGEVLHALDIGFAPERIVFDSPVKTIPELSMTFLLKSSFSVNLGYLWQSASLNTELCSKLCFL